MKMRRSGPIDAKATFLIYQNKELERYINNVKRYEILIILIITGNILHTNSIVRCVIELFAYFAVIFTCNNVRKFVFSSFYETVNDEMRCASFQ